MTYCKGNHYRYTENEFINSNGEFVFNKRVRYLKKKSCENSCQPNSLRSCDSEWLSMKEIGYLVSDSEKMPELPEDVKHGDTLKLRYSISGSGEDAELEELWFEVVEEEDNN